MGGGTGSALNMELICEGSYTPTSDTTTFTFDIPYLEDCPMVLFTIDCESSDYFPSVSSYIGLRRFTCLAVKHTQSRYTYYFSGSAEIGSRATQYTNARVVMGGNGFEACRTQGETISVSKSLVHYFNSSNTTDVRFKKALTFNYKWYTVAA